METSVMETKEKGGVNTIYFSRLQNLLLRRLDQQPIDLLDEK
jgi:hypothetical protein